MSNKCQACSAPVEDGVEEHCGQPVVAAEEAPAETTEETTAEESTEEAEEESA